MNKPKTKTTKTSNKNKYLLQMTRRGVFLGICLIFFISAWMFVLGTLVGRFIPAQATNLIQYAAGALFILMGIWTIWKV